jgi:hypothetical protein
MSDLKEASQSKSWRQFKMKRVVLLSITLAVFAGLAHGHTSRWHDGDWWRTLPEHTKLGFVMGYVEGAYDTQPSLCREFPAVVNSIDNFYADHRNTSMWVGDAIVYACVELGGESPEGLDRFRRALQASEPYRIKEVR